jgi:hypothetical protein
MSVSSFPRMPSVWDGPLVSRPDLAPGQQEAPAPAPAAPPRGKPYPVGDDAVRVPRSEQDPASRQQRSYPVGVDTRRLPRPEDVHALRARSGAPSDDDLRSSFLQPSVVSVAIGVEIANWFQRRGLDLSQEVDVLLRAYILTEIEREQAARRQITSDPSRRPRA